jgi:hypothetical protein
MDRIIISTADLGFILGTVCEPHEDPMGCDICKGKIIRLAHIFKKHTPKDEMIEQTMLFKLMFPKYEGAIPVTHLLYAYQCVILYFSILVDMDTNLRRKEKLQAVISDHIKLEEALYEQIKSDSDYCIAMESAICFRMAAINLANKGCDFEDLSNKHLAILLHHFTGDFKVYKGVTPLGDEYKKYYAELKI